MAYKLLVSIRAQNEIEKILDFYNAKSIVAPNLFIENLDEAYKILVLNPHFEIKYKNVRSLKIKRFPISLYFTINEKRKIVKILSCFHNKQNPQKRPKK